MPLFLRLALRNVFRHRLRTAVALSAIAIGCAGLIVNAGIIFNIFRELREDAIHGRYGHFQIYRLGYSDGYLSDPERYLLPRNEAERIAELVAATPGVAAVTREREFSGMIANGRYYVAFVGIGVDPDHDAQFSRHVSLRRGEPLSSAHPHAMVAGLGLAAKFAGEPGTVVTLLSHTASGALNAADVELRGIFEGGMKAYDDWTLKLPLDSTAQLLLDDRVERLLVLLEHTDDLPRLQPQIEARLRAEGLAVETRAWSDLALFHNQVVDLFRRELDVIRLIVATIVVLGIANTIGMSILERRVELATLRALGVSKLSIGALLLTEAAVTGLLGGLLGLGLGAVIASAVTAIGIPFPSPPGSTRPFTGGVDLDADQLVAAFVLSVLAVLAAALLPVWRALRGNIATTLRGG